MNLNNQILKQNLPFELPIIVTQKNHYPCIELRRVTTNTELIKIIISCAFHDKPITILPTFQSKIKGISSCMEKGILYHNPKDNQYYFTI